MIINRDGLERAGYIVANGRRIITITSKHPVQLKTAQMMAEELQMICGLKHWQTETIISNIMREVEQFQIWQAIKDTSAYQSDDLTRSE